MNYLRLPFAFLFIATMASHQVAMAAPEESKTILFDERFDDWVVYATTTGNESKGVIRGTVAHADSRYDIVFTCSGKIGAPNRWALSIGKSGRDGKNAARKKISVSLALDGQQAITVGGEGVPGVSFRAGGDKANTQVDQVIKAVMGASNSLSFALSTKEPVTLPVFGGYAAFDRLLGYCPVR